MIAPVTFAQLPADLVDPVNDVTGLLPRDGAPYNVDQWDGYTDDRRELFTHIRDRRLRDVVFLTGDIHSGWACDLPQDVATYPVSESAGVEFVCTSVTSNNLKDITGSPARTSSLAVEGIIQANNRHVKYLNFDDHGYSVLDVTPSPRPDGLVRDRRPRGPRRRGALDRVVGHRLRGQQQVVPVSAPCRMKRRSLITLAATGGLTVALSSAADAPARAAGDRRRRAYVLVLDGCRPDEITPALMPRTSALRDEGLDHPYASSVPVMETIPNHVMMMTGVRPDRSGVPANSIYDRSLGEVRDLDRAEDIKVRTVIERLNQAAYTTGTVLSKEYLYGIFGTRATHRWEPGPVVPVSGHAPDSFTMAAALAMLEHHDPNLMFVNLGDIDRMGHSDVSGPLDLKLLRQAALASTDVQVGRFVDALKASGRWSQSLVIVLADHSMDWSTAGRAHQPPAARWTPTRCWPARW